VLQQRRDRAPFATASAITKQKTASSCAVDISRACDGYTALESSRSEANTLQLL
jgi:hypothetical protein